MSVDLIIGMQYGSEGKGKIASMLAPHYDGAVRVGAPNAGHTIIHKDQTYKMRQIPCAWTNPRCRLFIGAGGMINTELLANELFMLPSDVPDRLRIDGNCGILTEDHVKFEAEGKMNDFNGSTSEGVGAAQAQKVLRKQGKIARSVKELSPYITSVSHEVNRMDLQGLSIMIEGTQGHGLSLNHGPYPYVTSRDVLASSLLSDTGISPRACRNIFGVMRTYPIRVAGNSGPVGAQEITWAEVARRAGIGSLEERTTVTKRIRRVFEQDWALLSDAVLLNRPTGLFLMFGDYLDGKMSCKTNLEDLSRAVVDYIGEVEAKLGVPILGVSTGPANEDFIWTTEGLEVLHKLKQIPQEV